MLGFLKILNAHRNNITGGRVCLTQWGRDKMVTIFQTTFSNAFSWTKMYELRLRFHWRLFPRVQLTIFQHWFRWWLGAGLATSRSLNQWWLVYWRLYASLCLNESLFSKLLPKYILYLARKDGVCVSLGVWNSSNALSPFSPWYIRYRVILNHNISRVYSNIPFVSVIG